MNKTILIVNISSIVDLITNSSSEIFISNCNKTIEIVEDILIELAKEYNKLPKEKWEKSVPENKKYFFKEICNKPEIQEHYNYDYDYDYAINKGDIVIYSACGNSIPYKLMEMIEKTLNAQRIHLG